MMWEPTGQLRRLLWLNKTEDQIPCKTENTWQYYDGEDSEYAHSGNKHNRQVEILDNNINLQPTTPMWVREITDQRETKYFN